MTRFTPWRPNAVPESWQVRAEIVNAVGALGDLATRQTLEWTFPSPAAYEAYAVTEHSKAYIRGTYGIRVIIVRDRSSTKGYQVLTAFPTTPKR